VRASVLSPAQLKQAKARATELSWVNRTATGKRQVAGKLLKDHRVPEIPNSQLQIRNSKELLANKFYGQA